MYLRRNALSLMITEQYRSRYSPEGPFMMIFLTAYAACMLIFVYLYRGLNAGFLLFSGAAFFSLYLHRKAQPMQEPSRIAAYDRLRLLGLVLIIATHTIHANMNLAEAGSLSAKLAAAGWMVTIVCNPLYVMLCGALLYRRREASVPSFYLDKVIRVMLPMFLYYLWYLWAHEKLAGQAYAMPVSGMLRDFFSMAPPEAPHFWLIWRILFLYLTAPFVGRLLRSLSYRRLSVLIFCGLALLAAITYLPLLTNSGITRSEWPEWIFASAFGWWISREETRKFRLQFIIAGALCGCLIALSAFRFADHPLITLFVCNTAPLALLFTAGIFSLFLYISDGKTASRLMAFLAEYNYDCVLVHWGALYFIVRELPGFAESQLPPLLITLPEILLTLVFSLPAAFGIRRFLVYPVLTLAEKLRQVCRSFMPLCSRSR